MTVTEVRDGLAELLEPAHGVPHSFLHEALLEERAAYVAMRALVPDLALPVAARRPLNDEQVAAIEHHQRLRERLEGLRSGHRRTAQSA